VTLNPTHVLLLFLAILVYILVTLVMTLLGNRIHHEMKKYQLVHESKLMRRQYALEVLARQDTGTGNVDVVEDEVNVEVETEVEAQAA
jgi:hypothetical protein